MNINRHNYEEYFILYADKELSSDDRRMVEEFVLLNPDLKDELDIYLNTVLLPEATTSFDKEDLYHYDESLISYIDDELSADEKLRLEQLINTSPKLQQEFDLYKKTKLQPDTDIAFENKSALYRTERRRVVPMTIIRWSVAAAILLAIAITAVNIINNKSSNGINEGLASQKTDTTKIQNNNPINTNERNVTVTDQNSNIKKSTEPGLTNKDQLAQSVNKKTPLVKEKKIDIGSKDEKQNENIAVKNQQPPSNNLPTPEYETIKTNATAYNSEPVTEDQKNVKGSNDVTKLKPDPYIYAGGPTTKEIDPNEEGGNKKSRGFFRKLTRVLEKNTGIKATDDDDKLHIAAFTVKLK